MKISERFIDGDGSTFHVAESYDPNPVLENIKRIRETGNFRFGDSYHVGRVPMWMITIWLKEAGVSWSDAEARNDVIRRKLTSGDFSALRNWQGRY